MNSIFDYLKNNSSINVLPDRNLNNQWQNITMNRTTLAAFMRTQQEADSRNADSTEKTEKTSGGSYLEKYIEKSTEQLADTENTEKTADTKTDESITAKTAKDNVKDKEKDENYLRKFFRQSTEKLSKPNKELSSYSTEVSDSVKRLEDAIEKAENDEEDEEDEDDLYNAASEMVNNFNSFAQSIRNSGNSTVNGKAKFIDDMINAFDNRLERVGITRNDDGTMSVDRDRLNSASPRDIQRALGKKDSFASFVDEQAKQLASYAQTDVYQRSSAYNNAGNITAVSYINGSFMNMLG